MGEQEIKSGPVATTCIFTPMYKDISSMRFLSLKEVSDKKNFISDSPGETRKFCKYNMLVLTTMFINNR